MLSQGHDRCCVYCLNHFNSDLGADCTASGRKFCTEDFEYKVDVKGGRVYRNGTRLKAAEMAQLCQQRDQAILLISSLARVPKLALITQPFLNGLQTPESNFVKGLPKKRKR